MKKPTSIAYLIFAIVILLVAPFVLSQVSESGIATGLRQLWEKNGTSIFNTNQGNVGIGTQDPQFKLHVLGDVAWTGILQSGFVPWASLINFPALCPPGEFVTGIGSTVTCSAPPSSGANISGTAGYIVKFGSQNTLSDAVIYESNGNVGIGTTNLTGKFQVYSDNISIIGVFNDDPTASMLSSSGLTIGNLAYAVDDNIGSDAWHTDSSVAGSWLKIDLGQGVTRDYIKARLYSNGATGNAGVYSIQFSDDNTTWTTASGLFALPSVGWNQISWYPVGNHRYWRFLLTNTPGQSTWISELEMYINQSTSSGPGNGIIIKDNGDVGIGSGLILHAIDGPNCYRLTVDNYGILSVAPTNCP